MHNLLTELNKNTCSRGPADDLINITLAYLPKQSKTHYQHIYTLYDYEVYVIDETINIKIAMYNIIYEARLPDCPLIERSNMAVAARRKDGTFILTFNYSIDWRLCRKDNCGGADIGWLIRREQHASLFVL
jgi:hypothetical protein